MAKHHIHYDNAVALRARILAGQSNQTPVMAWAAVYRECTFAENSLRRELNGQDCTRADLSFLNNLESIRWIAAAQREHHARINMAKLTARVGE